MKSIIRVVFISTLYLGCQYLSGFFDENLKIHFLDVGQGDAILVEFPSGELMLVDGGEGSDVIVELGGVLKPWKRRIDILVLTHPHMDHMGGLFELIDRYRIKDVWLRLIGYKTSEFHAFLSKINSDIFHNKLRLMERDFCLYYCETEICTYNTAKISTSPNIPSFIKKVWGEPIINQEKIVKSGKEVNNSSIVLLISYGKFDILLMGDAEIEIEDKIAMGLSKKKPIEVLKAGHHCSRTASSEKLLTYIRPEIAICSCGKDNSFGHPHEETIERFESLEIPYLRTDIEGRISIESDGKTWWRL